MSNVRPHHPTRRTRHRRPVRLALTLAGVALALVPLAACGGGDDSGSAAEDADTTAPTTAEATTTAAPREEADRATKDLASAAILQAQDFPEGWTQYAEGERWTPDEESCAAVDGGGPEDTLLDGAVLNGPSMQLGDAPLFVSSRAYVFPTEADAIAWVDLTKGDAWGECERTRFQEAYYPDGGAEMRVVTRDNDALGQSGFESYLELNSENDDGQVSAAVVFGIYRLGRTVIRTAVEDAGSGADSQAVTDAQYAALTAAYDRVNALG